MSKLTVLFCICITVSLLAVVGCTKETPAPTAPPVAAGGGDGKAIFTAKCAGCHAVAGVGGNKGPDLTHAGAKPEHTAEGLAEFIKNPKSKDPGSRMPAFGGRMSDADIQAVSAYLVSLK